MASSAKSRPVVHLVESAGGDAVMFGKERVIFWLMQAQRARGAVSPRLAVFSPCLLAKVAGEEGFSVDVLGAREQTLPLSASGTLRRRLRSTADQPVLHTHGYKSNIIGRLIRLSGAPMSALVSTCHGFINDPLNVRFYNAVDRVTAAASDAVTAPDPGMLARFPHRARTRWVPNAIPDKPAPDADARRRARARFGWTDDRFVAGMLGRFSIEKGVHVFAEASRGDGSVLWAAAGSGPLESQIRATAPPALACVGYVSPADDFLAAIDVYVQPSLTEGLSLSLLEAMRAALPIVATDVGATAQAVRDGREALLVKPDPDAIAAAVASLRADEHLRRRLGAAARASFFERFRMDVIERTYGDLYDEVAREGS